MIFSLLYKKLADFRFAWKHFTLVESHFLSWTYKSADELGGTSFKGEMATYSGAGYTQNLHQSLNVTNAILAELQQGRWIDQV